MKDDILLKLWLEKSDTALEDTKKNVHINSLETAQNRLYYAIFYAVSALAKLDGFATSKHTQLLGWFNRNYIHSGKIDRGTAEIYREAFDLRQKSDYQLMYVPEKQELVKNIQEAEQFIAVIKSLIAEHNPGV
ncbi:MAG: HEPN domain-containing protein [Thermoguttaceae bacterium]